jgi:hypothetical protein
MVGRVQRGGRLNCTCHPSAAGHHYKSDLTCQSCGQSWQDHQLDPKPCPKPLDYGKFQLTRRAKPEGEHAHS